MVHVWTYDVFLSFRGTDTRKGFTSHLLSAFRREGISYYKDTDQDEVGRPITPKLIDAIHHSKIGLILFSENYADSKWCLDELVRILDCNKKENQSGHMVVPIFYGVDPRDVRRQSGKFGEGFGRCENQHEDDKELLERWRSALKDAGNKSGWELKNHANGYEADFVDMIVREVRRKVHEPLYKVEDMIGVKSTIEDVVSLCNVGTNDVLFLGIYGIQGIGKTVIAKMLYSHIFDMFEGFSFLTFVGDAPTQDIVLHQKKLLHDILKPRESMIMYDVHTNKEMISTALCRKKVLVFLDNVDNKSEVNALAGDRNWFGQGSRVLIITRNRTLLNELKVDDKYMVTGLDTNASLRLFCKHAFQSVEPKVGYHDLCESFLHYAAGLPLALKNLGSFLYKKTKKQWHEALEKLEKDPHLDMLGVHMGPVSSLLPFKSFGPYGGHGGVPFDDGIYSEITQICVGCDTEMVRYIVVYYNQNGCLVRSFLHGSYVKNIDKVTLQYPDEYLVSISGFIRETSSHVITSLKLTSNRRAYKAFGKEIGKPFDFPIINDGKIIGFKGRCGASIDSIGAYVAPIRHAYPFEIIGPFGGEMGETWDDGKYTGIRQIYIFVARDGIESITIIYDKYGHPKDSITHGKSGEKATKTMVELDHLFEYLISISGYMRVIEESIITIQSLTFHSNMNIYGPYGTEEGKYFSFPSTGGKIVGLFGSCHSYLESIGAYFEPISHNYHLKTFGPFGGGGQYQWDDGEHDGVHRIIISCGSIIDSVSFQYGTLQSSKHGGTGGENYTINLDWPCEYLTSISGCFGAFKDFTVIQSLMFHSTRRTYGPYGTGWRHSPHNGYFSLPPNVGKIVGFKGTCGRYLESIGAYVKPYCKKMYPFDSVGLFGSKDGDSWDDGKYTNVKQIIIMMDNDGSVIKSIQFEYERDGDLIQSPVHGGNHNGKRHQIKLENDEYFTSFSGYIEEGDHEHVQSLTFQSNKGIYGPFGTENGKYFSSPLTGGKINGFYGRSGEDHLHAIGVYFEPVSLLYPLRQAGPFGGPGGNFWHHRGATGIILVKIFVGGDNDINCIAINHDYDGNPVFSSNHGSGRGVVHRIELRHPHEYLTSISGYISDDTGIVFVRSLSFQSNLKWYGPYGKEEGKYFWYPSTGTRIVSFFGRAGTKLDAIGVYTEPMPHLYPFNFVGPFGGRGGISWNDGIFSDVRAIALSVGSVVSSICFEYDNNGTSIQCSKHGRKSSTDDEYQVKLDFPKEYLISVSGYFRRYMGYVVVGSLTFMSNKRKYGPYGTEQGDRFSFDGRIVGFHGSSGSFLDSIGANLEPH